MTYLLVVGSTDAAWKFTKEIRFSFHATRTIETTIAIEIKLIILSNLQ